MTEPTGADQQHLNRLVFFSDGVFAIAITLLAIEIHPPHGWDGRGQTLWAHVLLPLAAFAVSFAVMAAYWLSHRRIFERIVRTDGWLDTLNILSLGLVVLLPAATELLFGGGLSGDALVIYLSLIALIGISQSWLWLYAGIIGRLMSPSYGLAFHWWQVLTTVLTPILTAGASLFLMRGASLPALAGVAVGLAAYYWIRGRVSRALRAIPAKGAAA